MRIIDPGHRYELENIDGPGEQTIQFVKRTGPKYPGNDHPKSGIIIQENLRAIIDRLYYVNRQEVSMWTTLATWWIKIAFLCLEIRAARRHSRPILPLLGVNIHRKPHCKICGHLLPHQHDIKPVGNSHLRKFIRMVAQSITIIVLVAEWKNPGQGWKVDLVLLLIAIFLFYASMKGQRGETT